MKEAENESASLLKDGQVIRVASAKDLKMKLDAAAKMFRLAIVYFTATWCGPCVHIGPIFTNLASKYPKVVFLKLDIDEARDAAAEWRIQSIPSFYLWKDGRVVDEELQMRMSLIEKMILEHTA
ncbi:TPR repeat-containing thioredoxin TDX-like [Salvia splendens]|uniref:TPR repeat-containing thioredoxin TDX-like n=1 Tax=Salvia splendens TaxID=180675 RepID=UPI001C26B810|nr:TPR repeat-containing thioredoxin TDX-like [Salvia splendens]